MQIGNRPEILFAFLSIVCIIETTGGFVIMIGIIGAMKIEIEKTEDLLENKSEKTVSGIRFVSGTLHGREIVTAVCGIGKVAAAICTEAMILEYEPECIINTGVAGGLADDIDVCDVVIAESLVQHDMDTTAIGDAPGLISGLNIVYIPADEKVSSALFAAAETAGTFKVKRGKIASGDQFIADAGKKDFIIKTFGASACEMEGASIAQVCYSNSMPFGVVRAISDRADGSGHIDYSQFLPLAAENAAKIIENFVNIYK